MTAQPFGVIAKPLTGKGSMITRLLVTHTGPVAIGEGFSLSRPGPML